MSEGIMVPRIASDGGMRELHFAKLPEAPTERNDVTSSYLGSC